MFSIPPKLYEYVSKLFKILCYIDGCILIKEFHASTSKWGQASFKLTSNWTVGLHTISTVTGNTTHGERFKMLKLKQPTTYVDINAS